MYPSCGHILALGEEKGARNRFLTLQAPAPQGGPEESPEGGAPVVRNARARTRRQAAQAARRTKPPERNDEEEHILWKAQSYLLFEAKRPMFWNVAEIREEKGESDSRRWIIAVHLRAPSGHEGYLGDLLYDGERFTELTDVEVMRERVRQIVADFGSLPSIE